MANGFGSFYVGNSGLQSAQNALNVTANNLANVNTTGYVREQVIFSEKQYNTFRAGTIRTNVQQNGLGVSIGDVVHARDVFLDKAYRLESGRGGFYSTSYATVYQVQDLFQELNGQEFKESINDLGIAFQELAKAPSDSVNQNLVVQKSELFVSRCQALYSDLQSYQSNMNEQIKESVDRINEIGDRIYELNLYIQKVEAGSVETAMTVRDERDALLDELSSFGRVTTREDQYGFVWVDFEDTEFVQEYGCNNIGLKADNGTGFYTPYWPQLSDVAHKQYIPVCRTDTDISSENNTDIGSLKALVYHRGTGYGRYTDLENSAAYKQIEDCVMMETEAQMDLLFHKIVTTLNDLFCPNTTAEELLGMTQGQTITAYDANGRAYTIQSDTVLLDSEHANVGADKKLPPQELFARLGCERYTDVTYQDAEGKVHHAYLYNEEDPADNSTMYQIGSVKVNDKLVQQQSLLPTWTQNGAVDYNLGERILGQWSAQDLRVNPKDNSPVNFQTYYDKVVSTLGTTGNVYYSESQTLDNTVNSLNHQRLQVMGVSSDEELTNMVRYQAAYNAASRYITVISEMTQLIVTGLI